MGIEPTSSAWKAEVLPLNYTRLFLFHQCLNSGAQKFRQSLLINLRSNCPNFKFYISAIPKEKPLSPLHSYSVVSQAASHETLKPSTDNKKPPIG